MLSKTATRRETSLFTSDIKTYDTLIREAVNNKNILVIGGAGSIGSNTIHTLVKYRPAKLHIIDQNENALAELVRELRSSLTPMNIQDFRTLPLDFGSPVMHMFMQSQSPYDQILNFAAIKHVRSEKDTFSILQMFDTNIVKQARFRGWIAETSPNADYFSVSTDKAANPVSFMGATKRVMEHILFDNARESGLKGKITSARFANVAYSNGSLLQAFEKRLARGEPLACPLNIKRYFVSLEESGHICTLASIIPPHEHIAIPRLDPKEHLIPLQSIAERFLNLHGYEPEYHDNERKAISSVSLARSKGKWPLLLTPANTAGEKPYEEFVGRNEIAKEIGMVQILSIPYVGVSKQKSLSEVLSKIESSVIRCDTTFNNKEALKAIIGEIEPNFLQSHIESQFNLDQRV
ncbi:polysaccharide biosynthesis protein [Hellea sp.]|nr:polysaccharide biosynthesis protein [Hellea sp.]MDB4843922.1 polysaccharide biosynthesis protein [Hellea sp.]MDC1061712.1 polysaccharide biosynthesis protein [Hellea sp.]